MLKKYVLTIVLILIVVTTLITVVNALFLNQMIQQETSNQKNTIIQQVQNQNSEQLNLSPLEQSNNATKLSFVVGNINQSKTNETHQTEHYPPLPPGKEARSNYWSKVKDYITEKIESERNTNENFNDEFQQYLDFLDSGYPEYKTHILKTMLFNGDSYAALALINDKKSSYEERLGYLKIALDSGYDGAYSLFAKRIKTGNFEKKMAFFKVAESLGSSTSQLKRELSLEAYKVHSIPIDSAKVEQYVETIRLALSDIPDQTEDID